ncbi:hypothetical protein OG884_05995 [Streptosporangium sp. NBC_01755]|uniref:hypothetical protein n=1 Tax=Streptosporangium sp. NBC_01755 TaxID=2975949 RepID=UPI002DDAC3C6|nr:hypothetical protein [Streptosporangium sp. NBC_01755]WSD01478.1 hypothetical protein OG884_05995 [Streptosporangium sp. NBC_01755]
MTTKQVTCVTVICDRCGAELRPDDAYTAHLPAGDTIEESDAYINEEWRKVGGRDLCGNCWTYGDPPDDDPDAEVFVELPHPLRDPEPALSAARPDQTGGLRARLDAALRPAMLIGLDDPLGEKRAGEWADWVLKTALVVRETELEGAREALADLDDIITTERSIHEATIARAEEAEEALDAHKAALARVVDHARALAPSRPGAADRIAEAILGPGDYQPGAALASLGTEKPDA